MIDLSNHVFIGVTTPGPPATEGTPLGTATHTTHRAQTWDLCKCGDLLHLWHGDWLRGRFEIWQHKQGGYVAIAKAVSKAL